MKATVKQIFNSIQDLNPNSSTVSSLGTFVTEQAREMAEMAQKEVLSNVSESSLAHKILMKSETFTEKQLWVIAYELLKNDAYTTKLGSEIAEREAKENAKIQASKDKLANNKATTQNVLDYVKGNGKLLKDYYSFLKSNRQYKKEFFSKKFTMESANEFINS